MLLLVCLLKCAEVLSYDSVTPVGILQHRSHAYWYLKLL